MKKKDSVKIEYRDSDLLVNIMSYAVYGVCKVWNHILVCGIAGVQVHDYVSLLWFR